MWLIIAGLIIVGAALLVVELVWLPGITLAGVGAAAADVAAVWLAFLWLGVGGGLLAIAAVLVAAGLAIWLTLRSNTWKKLSLKDNIEGTSQPLPQDAGVKAGDRGVAITRLAPMGKVSIGGKTYEAKSVDVYIDQRTEVQVVDFDNFNVIVTKI